MPCASGSQSQLAVDDNVAQDFDDVDHAADVFKYEFISETITGSQAQIDVSGMSGSRERRAQDLVDGPVDVSGDIVFNMTQLELDDWLPRILGGAESTDVFLMAETIPEFAMLIDRVASNGTRSTFAYKGCKVSKCVIAGSAGNPITMTLTIMGKTETFHGEVFPTAGTTVLADAQPYVFHEGVLTYNSLSFQYNQFELTFDNFAEARLENALTAEEICATDLAVLLNVNAPWIDTFAPSYNIADTAGSLVFTKSPASTDFTFGELVQTQKAPNVQGKGQIRWDLQLESRLSADGATPAITVTNAAS